MLANEDTAIRLVRDFCGAWKHGFPQIDDAIRNNFTDDCLYENVGVSVTTGPDEAIHLMERYARATGMASLDIEILAIAAVGTKVLTERIDHILRQDGTEMHHGRCMGIFEVVDGKIAAWRDYFDTAEFARDNAAERAAR